MESYQVYLQTGIWDRYKGIITGDGVTEKKIYDPIDADIKFHDNKKQFIDDYGHLRTELSIAPGTAELTPEQIKARVLIFIKIMHMITDDSVAECIAKNAQKKKDGSLYATKPYKA